MAVRQGTPGVLERGTQILGGVAIVVQVDLDLAISLATEGGQGIQVVGIIGFDRIEKRMPRWPSIAVAKFAEVFGIGMNPTLNARARDRLRLPPRPRARNGRPRKGSGGLVPLRLASRPNRNAGLDEERDQPGIERRAPDPSDEPGDARRTATIDVAIRANAHAGSAQRAILSNADNR